MTATLTPVLPKGFVFIFAPIQLVRSGNRHRAQEFNTPMSATNTLPVADSVI